MEVEDEVELADVAKVAVQDLDIRVDDLQPANATEPWNKSAVRTG